MRFLSRDDRLANYGRWGNVTRLTYLTIQWELLQSTVAKHTVLCLAEWKFRIPSNLNRMYGAKRNKNQKPNKCLCVGATTVKYYLTAIHFLILRIQIREYSISLKFLLFTPRKKWELISSRYIFKYKMKDWNFNHKNLQNSKSGWYYMLQFDIYYHPVRSNSLKWNVGQLRGVL